MHKNDRLFCITVAAVGIALIIVIVTRFKRNMDEDGLTEGVITADL